MNNNKYNITIVYKKDNSKELPTEKNKSVEKKFNLDYYAKLRLKYLKEHKKFLYHELVITDKLTDHLFSVSIKCKRKYNLLMNIFKTTDDLLSEKNKEINQFEWTKLMNNYKNIAKEIVIDEYVYEKPLS